MSQTLNMLGVQKVMESLTTPKPLTLRSPLQTTVVKIVFLLPSRAHWSTFLPEHI
jgi:hypothetical protein